MTPRPQGPTVRWHFITHFTSTAFFHQPTSSTTMIYRIDLHPPKLLCMKHKLTLQCLRNRSLHQSASGIPPQTNLTKRIRIFLVLFLPWTHVQSQTGQANKLGRVCAMEVKHTMKECNGKWGANEFEVFDLVGFSKYLWNSFYARWKSCSVTCLLSSRVNYFLLP